MASTLTLLPAFTIRATAAPGAGGGARKSTYHFLSSYATSGDPSVAARKFIAASSKAAALHALSQLLSMSSPLALPMYQRISETSWFKWNPKIAAGVIAVLKKQNCSYEADALIADAVSRHTSSSRQLVLFYCELIEALANLGLKQQALDCFAVARRCGFAAKKLYESMIKGYCTMGLARAAENMFDEMQVVGLKPSAFEFRLVVQCYGQKGLLCEMKRVIGVMERSGFAIDTVCANIVLSCYGEHGELSEMASYLGKMRALGIDSSVRTLNCVLNSCPALMGMMADLKSLPLSIEQLVEKIEGSLSSSSIAEALLVTQSLKFGVLDECMQWYSSEVKLDLHGLHCASAYLILLQWMDELRDRFYEEKAFPLEVSIVCGVGKHSSKRGESPVKQLVSEVMFRLDSPLKIDRKNGGRFVAKAKAVKEWLCCWPFPDEGS